MRGRAGVDGKAVIHDAITFDFTLNPDFSQIESDEPQVTINQRFEVFFPERRPFFLEHSGFFQTPENAEWNEAGGRVAVLVKRRRRASRFSSAWRAGMKKKALLPGPFRGRDARIRTGDLLLPKQAR